MPYRDDDDEELDDTECSGEEDGEDGDDETDTVTCPYCSEDLYDDAVRCPQCGNYLSREDAPSRPPLWIVVTAIICLAVVVAWIRGKL